MWSEEENKAIKYLEFLSNEKCECEACQRAKKEYNTILNLLDKQQNEIKRLKKDRDILYGVIDELKEDYGDHIPRID